MTIKITVHCDGYNCSSMCEAEDRYDTDIQREGWHVHPDDGYQHYCPHCWPKIMEELGEQL